MRFDEIFQDFKAGKKITRKGWAKVLGIQMYYQIRDDIIYFNSGIEERESNIDVKDMLHADDWEIYKEDVDWEKVINYECPCWVYDEDSCRLLVRLSSVEMTDSGNYYITTDNTAYDNCETVKKRDFNFYEDIKDK